jgi:integrase
MKKEGYRDSTIRNRIKVFKHLVRNCNLLDVEDFKVFLSRAKWCDGRKANAIDVYRSYARFKGFNAGILPNYSRDSPLPFIPLESEIDAQISGCGKKTSAFLLLLKETAFRPIEGLRQKWTDIDTERRTVNLPRPAKHSNPRQPQISPRLLSMLQNLPRKSDFIFTTSEPTERTLDNFRRNYQYSRKRLAEKLQNPRLMKITFRTLRHFKATYEYHRTKDILFVKEILGHKNIQNTMIYTHLVQWESDEYVCKIAQDISEASRLVESGFDYLTTFEGKMLFRKRK